MAMNKSEVIKGIARSCGLTVAEVTDVLDTFFDIVEFSVAANDDVLLSGFGKFEARQKKPVTRRNPRTGEIVEVPSKTYIGFVPARAMRARIGEGL